MRIAKFRIQNYKSWRDSGPLNFENGINVIVGQNNAGKTALLEGLTMQVSSNPHASLISKPTEDHILNLNASCEVQFILSANEFRSLFFNSNAENFFVPAHRTDIPADTVFSQMLKFLESGAEHSVFATFVSGRLQSARFDDSWYDGQNQFIYCKVNRTLAKLELVSHSFYSAQQIGIETIDFLTAQSLPKKIFLFKAERFNLGVSPIHSESLLLQNCSNLPQVLHYLHSKNPTRFKKFYELVSRVFPNITQITIPPVNSDAEIRIWFHDPNSERSDLAVPISQSGTGIGQVLAMLYVLVTSDRPQVLLIDEPQSFLHPGAIRSLLEIFKMRSEHQYILTTHTPTIIGMSNTVVQITYDGTESSAKVFDSVESVDTALILNDLGAKLSDVFGADKIMWVEGPTEENCFKLIIDHFKKEPLWGIQIIGVSSTGDLQGKHSEKVYQIYHKLSNAPALIPPAVAFIFDSEEHSEQFKNDLIKRSDRLVSFLKRRMYENYLIHSKSISGLINELDQELAQAVTEENVTAFILENCKDAFSSNWLKTTDGAKLLLKIFRKFTDGRYGYEKVKHGASLTKKILEHDPVMLLEVYETIQSALNK